MNAADRWAAAKWEPMLSERSAEIHRFLAVLDKEQHIQAAQQHGVDMEEVAARMVFAWPPGTLARTARPAVARGRCLRP